MLKKTITTRREIIKKLLLIVINIFFTKIFYRASELNAAVNSTKNTLYVIKGKDLTKATIEKMVITAFNSIGGIHNYIKKGMKVVLKPNIGFNAKPENAATTNPDLVEAVAKICIRAGAKVTIFDRSSYNTKLSYKNSGMIQAAKNAGAEIEYIDNRKFKTITVKNGLNLETLSVYEDMLKADFVINMPIAKDHYAAKLTMAMKNLMGVLGGNRGNYHINLHKNIVDFNKAIPVNLIILDATRILTKHGPGSGTPEDVKILHTIVIGNNAVPVDAYTAKTMFNIEPSSIEYLRLSSRENMGEINIHKMNIIKKYV